MIQRQGNPIGAGARIICMTDLLKSPPLSRRTALRAITVSVSALALGGCTRVLSGVAGLGSDVAVTTDLAYGPENRHRLDLYVPENATPETPVILFLYGGSWKWGSRSRYGFVGYSLASRGFAVAVADYRLYPDVRFPAFNFDAAQATHWLKNNSARFGLSAGPIHLVGHSAGAHIATLIALDPTYLAKWQLSANDIASVTGLAGPYAMHPSKISYIADIFPPAAQEDEARPVTFAEATSPPMLLLHGAGDGLVSAKNAKQLDERLRRNGNHSELIIYEKIGHKEIILALTHPFQGLAPVLDDLTVFINKNHA